MIKLKLQKGVNAMEMFSHYYTDILMERGGEKPTHPKIKILLILLPY